MAPSRPSPFPNGATVLLSTTALASSPHFAPLFALENEVFGKTGKDFIPESRGRFTVPQDMLDELGPYGFCLIKFEKEEGSEIIGTISAKPFEEPVAEVETEGKHPRMYFKRNPSEKKAGEKAMGLIDNGEGLEKWELLASAVAFRVKGVGVASILMKQCVSEIRERSKQMRLENGTPGEPKIVLYVSTIQELNEVYYQKKGFTTTNVKKVPQGVVGNREVFHIVEMMKIL